MTPVQSQLARLLKSDDAYGTTLLAIVLGVYDVESLEWTPTALRMDLEDDFGIQFPKHNFDKLNAAISILTSDDFFKRLPCFIYLCNALADEEFSPEIFDPADSFEMAWGITEALLIYPPDKEDQEPFSEDIRH